MVQLLSIGVNVEDAMLKTLEEIKALLEAQNKTLSEISKKMNSANIAPSGAPETRLKTTTFDFPAKILADVDRHLAENRKAAEGRFTKFGADSVKKPT
jgi:hypothetical protein